MFNSGAISTGGPPEMQVLPATHPGFHCMDHYLMGLIHLARQTAQQRPDVPTEPFTLNHYILCSFRLLVEEHIVNIDGIGITRDNQLSYMPPGC
jgi:hypothetical protein